MTSHVGTKLPIGDVRNPVAEGRTGAFAPFRQMPILLRCAKLFSSRLAEDGSMKIRLLLLAVAICTTFVAGSKAEERAKPARIGMLLPGSEASSAYLKGLYRGLVEQGLLEGKNISLEIRYANGRIDQLPSLAAELADRKSVV
jgi:hypothetical protein